MKIAPLVVILLATSALADDERPLPTSRRGESSGNLSVELTTFERITTLSFLLGYQSF